MHLLFHIALALVAVQVGYLLGTRRNGEQLGSHANTMSTTKSTASKITKVKNTAPTQSAWTPQSQSQSAVKDLKNVTIVILGASGDLAKRKLYPGLFTLFKEGLVPQNWNIIGYARSELSKEELVQRVTPFMGKPESVDKEKLDKFFAACHYVAGKYDSIDDFKKLNEFIKGLEGNTPSNRMFFLSLPPDVFLDAATCIGKTCRTITGWNRIVVEKPFGRDLETFEILSKGLNAVFEQHEIYRIDHYIGKEVVQNLLVLRLANVIFDPLWSRSSIKSVQLIFKEQLGVEGRGGYFDSYGIIRDVMQNHMMQILALIAMEPPISLEPQDISAEKVKVLKSISQVKSDDIVLGQYKEKVISGKEYPGYTQDPTVPDDSITPTFAACVLKVKNRRWDGVPFLLKCGKALDERCAEIHIQFHDVPGNLYTSSKLSPNELGTHNYSSYKIVIRIQPEEAIYFKIMNKVAGYGCRLNETQLDFSYKTKYQVEIPDAYARLFLDVLEGNETNFINEEELRYFNFTSNFLNRIQWKIFTPILKELEKNHVVPESYSYGSRGPVNSDYIAANVGVRWSEDK